MLKFAEFTEEIKGWMSPKGSAHYFDADLEHGSNNHPDVEYLNRPHGHPSTSDAVKHAQHMGYARFATFGRDDDNHLIHYDHKAKGGKEAALHALRELKPRLNHRIVINHRPWGYSAPKEKEFHSPGEAAHFIRNVHEEILTFNQFITEENEFPHFTSAEHVRQHFKAKYPHTDLQFHDSPTHHDHAHLDMIQVPKEHQRKGIGSHIMRGISHYADHSGKTVTLSPENRGKGQPSKSKLTSFYKGFGYKPNKGRNKDYRFTGAMIRTPKTIKEEEEFGEKPFKGWMSPSGKPHLFKSSDEHSENHHPEYRKAHPQGPAPNFPTNKWHSDQIRAAQKQGFVRFGKAPDSIHGKHIYIHYDAKHPQGHRTALETLRYLKLHRDEPVSISGHSGNLYSRQLKRELADRTLPSAHAMRDLHKRVHGITEAYLAEETDDFLWMYHPKHGVISAPTLWQSRQHGFPTHAHMHSAHAEKDKSLPKYDDWHKGIGYVEKGRGRKAHLIHSQERGPANVLLDPERVKQHFQKHHRAGEVVINGHQA